MASFSSSALSRYRPSVIATATLAAAGSIYFLYCFVQQTQEASHGSLRRSNAVRRRHNSPRHDADRDLDNLNHLIETAEQALADAPIETNDTVAAANTPNVEFIDPEVEAVAADDAETEQSVDIPPAGRDGTRLQELVYAIAKNNSEKEGIVHRGVTCDKCNRVPIVGVRYHCANCPDYDLCEDCEATDCHLKTHIFYKVKVPSPWGGKKPLPLWYPGDPTAMPSEIEDRAYKNRLADTSNFQFNKIDGLYQQFTCMANEKVDHVHQSSIRMGINRAAFDHCFIGQTMTDSPPVPNLIHDRLFAFYDADGDGVVDFTEFVMGTSMVHSKNRHLRNMRVFKGLDLDGDQLISRKDCMKIFRAYYELNKDIMLGYLGIEREGENADLVVADRDPRRHVASGRSLASYFNDGPPGGYQTNSGSFLKDLNAFNDYVPSSKDVETITGPSTTHEYDLMKQDEVSEYGWLNLFAVYNDEIFRLCAGKPMKWLDETQVRIFARTSRHLIEHNGRLWAADATYFGKSAYVRIENEDIGGSSNSIDYRSKLSDPSFHLTVHTAAKHRLCFVIHDATYQAGRRRQAERKEHDQFYLNEEPVDQSPSNNSCVGGTAAAHTIYTVIEDALTELLDPLFKPSERVALEVQKSASARAKYDVEIAAYIDISRQKIEELVPDYSENVDHPKPDKNVFGRLISRVENPDDVRKDAVVLRSALMHWIWGQMDQGTFNSTTAATDSFLMVLLQIEAELTVGWKTPDGAAMPDLLDGFHEQRPLGPTRAQERDPTMPQHRPTAVKTNGAEGRSKDDGPISEGELKRLARLEAAAQLIAKRGAPGLLDLEEFERKLQLTDDKGNTLLQWIGGWVDLVMF